MVVPEGETRRDLNVTASRHIVFISTSTSLGGGEMFLRELLPRLRDRGWNLTLIVPPRAPLADDPAVAACSEIIRIDLSMHVTALVPFLRSVWTLLKFARANCDALFYGNGFFTMKLMVLCRLLGGVNRSICHLHESSYEFYPTIRARVQAPLISRFIAISDAVRIEFERGAHVPRAKVSLVHNGVAIESLPPKSMEWREAEHVALRLPAGCFLVGMAARTNLLKGHAVLLEAWSRVMDQCAGNSRPLQLVIAGLHSGDAEETDLYQHLKQLIATKGLGPSVVRWSQVPLADVRRLMRAADLWVVPSTSEGFGRTAIEAMAEGTALVVSSVGGLCEIVTDGVDGVQVPPGDPVSLSAAIVALIRDDVTRNRLAVNGQLTARQRFSIEAMSEKIDAICSAVVAR